MYLLRYLYPKQGPFKVVKVGEWMVSFGGCWVLGIGYWVCVLGGARDPVWDSTVCMDRYG